MKKAVVTGGNGHLGFNLVKTLLDRGYDVTATVRDIYDPARVSHLKTLKNVRIVPAQLLDFESLRKAFLGADVVFHTASPNVAWSENPQIDIVRPIFEGTQNVFHAAKRNSISDLVFTSSCSAMGMDAESSHPITEELWNSSALTPLVSTKILAERWAWEFANANQIRLNTICPTSIIGPHFFRHTPTTRLYEKFLLGKMPPLPAMGFHLVDVRDVALAHALAFEDPRSNSRYIVASDFFESKQLLVRLKSLEPKKRVLKFSTPKSLLYFVCSLDWLNHRFSGAPRQLTLDMVKEFSGKYQRVDTRKIRRALGWSPRPVDETLRETLDWIQEQFLSPEIES